jgi:hypothetical protein
MVKSSKRNLLFITLLLTLLVLSSANVFFVPSVNAAELNVQEETLSVLSNVVGLKTELYTLDQTKQCDKQFLGNPQAEFTSDLLSKAGSLRVTCSFVKDTLQMVYLSDLEGEPSLKQSANNTVNMTKGLLERYQNYTGNSLYGEFASMLNDADTNRNVTKFGKDVKLEVSNSGQNVVSYTWKYSDENGVLAERKSVILLYEHGQFKGFFNSWPLYTIVNTPTISSEEATALAIEASKDYNYKVIAKNGTEKTVSGFTVSSKSLDKASLVYLNSKEQDDARGGDPFKLYPAWHVPLGFDKRYPGDVSGLTVILWADSGEVCGMNHAVTSFGYPLSDNPEDGSSYDEDLGTKDVEKTEVLQKVDQEPTVLFNIAVTAVVICVILVVIRKRAKLAGKKLSSKFSAILLCAITMFSVMLYIPITNATQEQCKSRIYACVDSPGGYQNEWADAAEKVAIAEICNYIGNASIDAGYDTSNQYGVWGTTVTNVVNDAGYDEQNYAHTMVFHAGHFSVEGRAYQDNNGDSITDTALYAKTSARKHDFVLLWVCTQADVPIDPYLGYVMECETGVGTPIGWTHRDESAGYMHCLGFEEPDDGGQCFISFSGYSPMLSDSYWINGNKQSVFYEYSDWTPHQGPCKDFVKKFYEYGLYDGYSIHDSLNLAAYWYFTEPFEDCHLYTGYNCWWPGGDIPPPYQFLSMSGWYPLQYQQWFDPDKPLNKMRVFGDSNVKFHYKLAISVNCPSLGYTTPSGTAQYTRGSSVEVQSTPYSGYVLNYWKKDGNNVGNTPKINVYMDKSHTLQAVFGSAPSYKYAYSIYNYGGTFQAPEYLTGWQQDGQFATVQNYQGWYGPYPDYWGWIAGTMNAQATGHIYVYGYADGFYSPYGGTLSVYVSVNGENWTPVSTPYVPSGSASWVDCGTYPCVFNYVKVAAENPSEVTIIYIDAIKAVP